MLLIAIAIAIAHRRLGRMFEAGFLDIGESANTPRCHVSNGKYFDDIRPNAALLVVCAISVPLVFSLGDSRPGIRPRRRVVLRVSNGNISAPFGH